MKALIVFLTLFVSAGAVADGDTSFYITANGTPVIVYHPGQSQTPYGGYNNGNLGGPYIRTNQNEINQAIYEAHRYGQVQQLQNVVTKYQQTYIAPSGASGTSQEISARSFQLFSQSISPYLVPGSGAVGGGAASIPAFQPPTPYPSGVSRRYLDEDMKPAWDAVGGTKVDPVRLANAVNRLHTTVGAYRSSDAPNIQRQADYIENELRRAFVDQQGILKNLPYAESPGAMLATLPSSGEGLRVRSGINQLLASESVVGSHCANPASPNADLSSACTTFSEWSRDMKAAYLVADQLGNLGRDAEFERTMSTLEKSSEFLMGFMHGLIDGTISTVDGVIQLATNLPGVANGLYEALTHLPRTWEVIKNYAENTYQRILVADAGELGQITGALSVEVLTTLIGPTAALKFGKAGLALTRATEYAVVRAAVEKGASIAAAAGKITAETSDALTTLARRWPNAARGVIAAKGIEKVAEATASLSTRAVQGLEKLDELSPGFAERALAEHTDDALFLGKNAAKNDSSRIANLLSYAEQEKFTIGKTAILSEFFDGAARIMKTSDERFLDAGEFLTSNAGKSTEVFVITTSQARKLIQEAAGDAAYIEKKLGLKPGTFSGEPLTLLEIPFDVRHRPKVPNGFEASANEYFRYGGTTQGGLWELTLKDVPANSVKRIQLGEFK